MPHAKTILCCSYLTSGRRESRIDLCADDFSAIAVSADAEKLSTSFYKLIRRLSRRIYTSGL